MRFDIGQWDKRGKDNLRDFFADFAKSSRLGYTKVQFEPLSVVWNKTYSTPDVFHYLSVDGVAAALNSSVFYFGNVQILHYLSVFTTGSITRSITYRIPPGTDNKTIVPASKGGIVAVETQMGNEEGGTYSYEENKFFQDIGIFFMGGTGSVRAEVVFQGLKLIFS